ncbi:AAA family ATPase [Gloeobacter kilaueensis]|uniref:Uncharacterized protein n=1 Tax=Gloeobacter kilaueensis (strain ATCC BAA-2537 / CCAP 1431/1 / ULC 316 / JS1) TaxID=1183438 RepID=U5QIB0_GLOK1|nr:AAA family ATPase [Gloeobacter kilaueensis]AGY58676.1 hypothetical protein GKIL_2430 [Gloeobacter kilaueensis JS1]
MLTRIEIDGFKTFEDFGIDIGPLLVVLGPNATGKSNLFDAIRFLSNLASKDLRSAVKGLRGEPHELFRIQPDGQPGTKMSFAVELLLESKATDPWGTQVQITHNRVRYEVDIERRMDEKGTERLVVVKEEAIPINAKDDRLFGSSFHAPSKQFRDTFMRYSRKTPWLTTELEGVNGKPSFKIFQDGRAGRFLLAEAAEATVLSSITTTEYRHLYAIREEMNSWKFLQLDPAVMRLPSSKLDDETLKSDGSNLATVLARIQMETASSTQPQGVLKDIAADLSSLISGIISLQVRDDRVNKRYEVNLSVREGYALSSRIVSDGTLRILALLTLLHDPRQRGLICFEEPENGIHPYRLKTLINRLRELVTKPWNTDISFEEPFSQILMNSHSPVVLSSLEEGEKMFSDMVSTVSPTEQEVARKTRLRPVRDQGELLPGEKQNYVSAFEVKNYLDSVDRAG